MWTKNLSKIDELKAVESLSTSRPASDAKTETNECTKTRFAWQYFNAGNESYIIDMHPSKSFFMEVNACRVRGIGSSIDLGNKELSVSRTQRVQITVILSIWTLNNAFRQSKAASDCYPHLPYGRRQKRIRKKKKMCVVYYQWHG